MKIRQTWVAAFAAIAGSAAATTAMAATFTETENNNVKLAANAFTLAAGDILTGTSTGTSTTTTGNASADFFRLRTGAAPASIYLHTLTRTSTAAHSGAIMGVGQSGAPSDTTTVQSATSSNVYKWYGFGKQEELYFRVTGTSSTTAAYTFEYNSTVITPLNGGTYDTGGPNTPGNFTFKHKGAIDGEIFLFDSNFNEIGHNDDDNTVVSGLSSRLDATLLPGTYYIAISDFNTASQTANGAAANGGNPLYADRSTAGSRTDFGDLLVRSSGLTRAANGDFGLSVDFNASGAVISESDGAIGQEVEWYVITVIPSPGSASLLALGGLLSLRRRRN
jgi:hypothetical protein